MVATSRPLRWRDGRSASTARKAPRRRGPRKRISRHPGRQFRADAEQRPEQLLWPQTAAQAFKLMPAPDFDHLGQCPGDGRADVGQRLQPIAPLLRQQVDQRARFSGNGRRGLAIGAYAEDLVALPLQKVSIVRQARGETSVVDHVLTAGAATGLRNITTTMVLASTRSRKKLRNQPRIGAKFTRSSRVPRPEALAPARGSVRKDPPDPPCRRREPVAGLRNIGGDQQAARAIRGGDRDAGDLPFDGVHILQRLAGGRAGRPPGRRSTAPAAAICHKGRVNGTFVLSRSAPSTKAR